MKRRILTIIPIFIFSVLLWVFISLSEEHFTTVTFKIRIVDIPENYSLSYVSTETVSVNVKGKGWQLTQLTGTENKYFDVSADEHSGTIRKDLRNELNKNDWVSSSYQVTEIVPSGLSFSIEPTISKIVPVHLTAEFNFQKGFNRVSDISIAPDKIKVFGPESLIKTLSSVDTKDASFVKIDAGFSEYLDLKRNTYIRYDVNRVLVSFGVQRIVDKRYDGVSVSVVDSPTGQQLELYPNKIDIVIRGGIDMLAEFDKNTLNPFVYFSQALNDTLGFVEPSIDLPEFIELTAIKPSKLKYIIRQYK